MSGKLVQKILKIDNHRNGVCGAPFGIVLFQYDNRKMDDFDESKSCGCFCSLIALVFMMAILFIIKAIGLL